jgi:DNA gyrase/topoisomerase IV subunit A
MSDEQHRYTPEEIDDLRERVDIFRALSAAIDRWPEVARLAFAAASPRLLVEQLCELLGIGEAGATAITEMQIVRLSEAQREKIRSQLAEQEAELARALEQGGS